MHCAFCARILNGKAFGMVIVKGADMHIHCVQLRIMADFKKCNKTSKDLSILWHERKKKPAIQAHRWQPDRKQDYEKCTKMGWSYKNQLYTFFYPSSISVCVCSVIFFLPCCSVASFAIFPLQMKGKKYKKNTEWNKFSSSFHLVFPC